MWDDEGWTKTEKLLHPDCSSRNNRAVQVAVPQSFGANQLEVPHIAGGMR